MCLAIRELLTRSVAAALVSEAWVRSKKTGKQHYVVIDGDRGYDPDAKSFPCDDQLVKGGERHTVNAIVEEALQFDECYLFLDGPEDSYADGHGEYVYLIFGNGNCDLDMISDYSMSLEQVVAPIEKLADGIGDGSVKLTTI